MPQADIFLNSKKIRAKYGKLSLDKNDEQLSNVMSIKLTQKFVGFSFQNLNSKKLIKKAMWNTGVFLVLAANSKFETPE